MELQDDTLYRGTIVTLSRNQPSGEILETRRDGRRIRWFFWIEAFREAKLIDGAIVLEGKRQPELTLRTPVVFYKGRSSKGKKRAVRVAVLIPNSEVDIRLMEIEHEESR